jgi:hypothetical protein
LLCYTFGEIAEQRELGRLPGTAIAFVGIPYLRRKKAALFPFWLRLVYGYSGAGTVALTIDLYAFQLPHSHQPTSSPSPSSSSAFSESTIGMDKHLCISVNPFIEFLVRVGSILNGDFVADDEAGFGSARYDEVAEVAVVDLCVALACC